MISTLSVTKDPMERLRPLYRATGIICALLLPAGCATGPDFKPPVAPKVSSYLSPTSPLLLSAAATGVVQRIAEGVPVESRWWQAFGSPALDALVEEGLRASPTLEAAESALRQARHAYEARAGSTQYPQADANVSGGRKSVNNAAMGQTGGENTFNIYGASVNVRYDFDLFGGNRRALEALAAQADTRRFQLEGARLTLAASIIATAFAQARLSAQIELTERILNAQREQLALTRRRVELGSASDVDVLALQTQMEQTRAGIPALRNDRDQANHLLAMLIGQMPSATNVPQFTLTDFTLPPELPLQVPSELIRRRPDIRVSEALLHAACAEHGVAVSKLYPQISLSADFGAQALTMDKLFNPSSLIWSLGGQLAQPLFNRGLRSEAHAAEAGFDAASAHYRETVLQAFRDVADVLRGLDHHAHALTATTAAAISAQETLDLVQKRYAMGAANYLEVLTAQQVVESSRMDLCADQAQRLIDTVTFYSAMGGGWKDDDKTNKE
jgi:NodT family efflux transporter outer membrane factor (OMF) lipoprotein